LRSKRSIYETKPQEICEFLDEKLNNNKELDFNYIRETHDGADTYTRYQLPITILAGYRYRVFLPFKVSFSVKMSRYPIRIPFADTFLRKNLNKWIVCMMDILGIGVRKSIGYQQITLYPVSVPSLRETQFYILYTELIS
jgi:hypothetical protein